MKPMTQKAAQIEIERLRVGELELQAALMRNAEKESWAARQLRLAASYMADRGRASKAIIAHGVEKFIKTV